MKKILAIIQEKFTTTKPDWPDALAICFFIGFGYLISTLLAKPFSIINAITIIVIIYFMIKTFYELTFNRGNIPTLETPFLSILKMAELVKIDWEDKDRPATYHIVDFGSGDGQLTRKIARTLPSATVLGIEFAQIPYTQSVLFKKLFRIKNVDYQQTDFFEYDCRNVDAVVMFLSVKMAQRLGEKLYNELKPGALVLSNEFELKGNWPTPETITRYRPLKNTLFVYRR